MWLAGLYSSLSIPTTVAEARRDPNRRRLLRCGNGYLVSGESTHFQIQGKELSAHISLHSVLVTLRDRGLPLPAGALLLSPWVDLMHSFPSVSIGPEDDFLPPYSFMHRPSTAWPPPSTDEIGIVRKSAKEILQHLNSPPVLDSGNLENHAIEGYFAQQAEAAVTPGPLEYVPPPQPSKGEHYIDPEIPMTLEVDGRYVQVKDQIHMYTTNHMLNHPLVSPVLQPSLGGLPPMLIVTGGGEMLRDEQIYLAHKAANPEAYPPSDRILNTHDPTRRLISRYKPTYVQLQVWDDLCHIPTALSFTNPGKLVSRSIAQFGAWALSHTQDCTIDIRANNDPPRKSWRGKRSSQPWNFPKMGEAGVGPSARAGDELPQFHNYMIRQRVDMHGNIYPLESESSLPALQMSPSDVGEAKREPLYRWMTAKQIWDEKYARQRRKVMNRRVEEFLVGIEEMEPGEHPPPCSLAARRGISVREVRRPARGSRAMAFWNRLSSKYDAKKLRKESREMEKEVSSGSRPWSRGSWVDTERQSMAQARRASYTRTVTDTGQADHPERDIEVKSPVRRPSAEPSSSRGGAHSSPANAQDEMRQGHRVDFDSANYYLYPDSNVPGASRRSNQGSLVPPAIPERSARRHSPDRPPHVVRNVDDVLTPVRGSSSSQVGWQTPRECMSYPSRYTTVNDWDQDGVLDQVDSNRLQVPGRGAPVTAPRGPRKDVGGADPDASIKTLRDALGTVRPHGQGQGHGQKDTKGKDIAFDLHSDDRDRVPSDTEPFPPYPTDENYKTFLSKPMSGYSSEYSVH